MSFKIHVPRLFAGRMSVHLVGRTNAASSKFAFSIIAELSSPCFPKLLHKGFLSIESSKRTLERLADQEGWELLSPSGICKWPLFGHVELDTDLLVCASSPYPLAVVVGSPVILSVQKTYICGFRPGTAVLETAKGWYKDTSPSTVSCGLETRDELRL